MRFLRERKQVRVYTGVLVEGLVRGRVMGGGGGWIWRGVGGMRREFEVGGAALCAAEGKGVCDGCFVGESGLVGGAFRGLTWKKGWAPGELWCALV